MTSQSKPRSAGDESVPIGGRVLGLDEKIARIVIEHDKGHLWCLAADCSFYIHVPAAPVPIMTAELKDFYRVHQRNRHPHFIGKTQYETVLGESWKNGSGT